ncbi:MAG: 30S ribosomal protein S8 [Rhodospirillaceae bacterium]|jgi:small subunit ribosomal protein S8|nr:30S ribosomal protein S8 [Rhodospirillaceae bacterium]
MMTDPLGDMLTRIRNGQMAKKSKVTVPASRICNNVLEVLKREGYIRCYSQVELRSGVCEVTIELKYYNGIPVIHEISRISKPGRRVYSKIKNLPRVSNGLGISILSTSHGVMSNIEAIATNIGGEIFCRVF